MSQPKPAVRVVHLPHNSTKSTNAYRIEVLNDYDEYETFGSCHATTDAKALTKAKAYVKERNGGSYNGDFAAIDAAKKARNGKTIARTGVYGKYMV